ncbi:hypothetical protein MRB53_042151 [Persea americana]|nr:hypothetical protein MRB53_042151 [Persea americana]
MDATALEQLQSTIEVELSRRFGADESTIAEYIVVMLQNGKDRSGITAELSDLITDYDASFTDWVFRLASNEPETAGDTVDQSTTLVSQTESENVMMDTDETKGKHRPRTDDRGNPYADGTSRQTSRIPQGPKAPHAGPIRTTKNRRQNPKSTNQFPEFPQIPGFPTPAEFFRSLPLADRMGVFSTEIRPPSRRCTKWPTCFKGKACTFGHPQSICQNPNCKRRDGTCINIHSDEDIDLASGMQRQLETETERESRAATKLTREHMGRKRNDGPDQDMTDAVASPVCKFGEACTNRSCHFSHPSPASRNGSSIVLNSEVCAADMNCKDEQCSYSHSSPSNQYTPGVKLNGAISAPSAQCKFFPCLNISCRFQHDQDQKLKPGPFRGARNKVWTPASSTTGVPDVAATNGTAQRTFAVENTSEQFSADSNVHANDQEMEK